MTYQFDSSINEIGNLASGIFLYDFDEDSGVIRPEYVSGWLQNNLGELNVLTHSCFKGENPGFSEEEQSIYRQIFLKSFYGKLARKTLMGLSTVQTVVESEGSGSSEMSDWIELREGDSYIKRQVTTASPSTKVSASRQYSSYAQESELTLKDLIYKYNQNKSGPIQVVVGSYSDPCKKEAKPDVSPPMGYPPVGYPPVGYLSNVWTDPPTGYP